MRQPLPIMITITTALVQCMIRSGNGCVCRVFATLIGGADAVLLSMPSLPLLKSGVGSALSSRDRDANGFTRVQRLGAQGRPCRRRLEAIAGHVDDRNL